MADWRDDYRQGSFRGVEFKTLSHEFRSGRRNVDHEFPSKEEGNSEDIGKRLPRYNLNVYVLGDDYFSQRDALIDALDSEGSGELIHPYLGTKQVQVSTYSVAETVEEGRIARFSVEFVESGEAKFPGEDIDAFQSVLDAVEGVFAAANSAFEAVFTVINSPARVAEAAAELVDTAATGINNIARTVGSSAQAVADVGFAIRNIQADVEQLIRTPDQLAQRFKDAFDLLFDAVEDAKELSESLSNSLSNFSGDDIVNTNTPTNLQIQGNQLALENLIIQQSVSTSSRAAVNGNYVSVDESVNVRDLISSDIDTQLERVDDDEVFQKLRDLKASINKALPPTDIGDIVVFTPPKSLPVLVVSHKLFGSIAKEQEIIDENKIRHPGFAPARQTLEVASD